MDDKNPNRENELMRARLLMERGKYNDALRVIAPYLTPPASDTEARLIAAAALLLRGQALQALLTLGNTEEWEAGENFERYIILKAEALRVGRRNKDALDHIDYWLEKVSPENRSRLLWRRAAILRSENKTREAAAAIRDSWATRPPSDNSYLRDLANWSCYTGEFSIAKEAALELRRTRDSLGALPILVLSTIYTWNPAVRLGLILLAGATMFLPGLLKLVFVAAEFVLALGTMLGRRSRFTAITSFCAILFSIYSAVFLLDWIFVASGPLFLIPLPFSLFGLIRFSLGDIVAILGLVGLALIIALALVISKLRVANRGKQPMRGQ